MATGPATTESECQAVKGRLLEGSDPFVQVRAGGLELSVTLPGVDWCEVSVHPRDAHIRSFIHLTPRVAFHRMTPEAGPWLAHVAMVELALFPPTPDRAFPSPEKLRADIEEFVRRGQPVFGAGGAGILALARRGNRLDIGAIDPATRCFPLALQGNMRPPEAQWIERHFEMQARACFAPPGVDGLGHIQFLQEWAVVASNAPQQSAAYRAVADRIFASVRIEPAQ